MVLGLLPGIAAWGQPRDGFAGYTWGTPLDSLKAPFGLELYAENGTHGTYTTGMIQLEDIALDECRLEFVGNRFAGVVIMTRGHEASDRMLEYLRRIFGGGTDISPLGWSWFSQTTYVTYDKDSHGDAYIYWYSPRYQR